MSGLPELWKGSVLSPLQRMSRLQRTIDRMFDEFMAPLGRVGFEEWPTEASGFAPPCDVEESDTHYVTSFDLPGVKKDDIRVEMVDNQLVVSGERKEEHEEKGKGRYQKERYYGSFQRVFTLPKAGENSKVEASFQDGVLRVVVPKIAGTKAQTIKITEGFAKKTEKAA